MVAPPGDGEGLPARRTQVYVSVRRPWHDRLLKGWRDRTTDGKVSTIKAHTYGPMTKEEKLFLNRKLLACMGSLYRCIVV